MIEDIYGRRMQDYMTEHQTFLLNLSRYAASCLTGALAIPFWLRGESLLAIAPLVAAVVCHISIRSLVQQVEKAKEQQCFLDLQLIQSQKLAAIGELSSGIAHEINNPLAIIGQEIEWIRHILNTNEEANNPKGMGDLRDSLREIAQQVERCGEITHKLLDFARKKEPLIQGVEINRLVEDMAKLVEREASDNNITIVRNYGTDLPIVQTDAPLVRQVVLNILNNATYAVRKDGAIIIETRLLENSCIDIAISDSGCGIPEEDLDRIFDPFFTTKPIGKGTGLGLSICHGIISRLGGKILVESEVGRGTKFTVRLPLGGRKGET